MIIIIITQLIMIIIIIREDAGRCRQLDAQQYLDAQNMIMLIY